MGLVDYDGSESDSDQEEEPKKQTKEVESLQKTGADEDTFFGDDDLKDSSSNFNPTSEDALEEIVKPKDWELKLAEKAKRKLEKKALKKAQKTEKKLAKKANKKDKISKVGSGIQKSKRAKIVISAFGGLPGISGGNSSDDEENEDEKVVREKPFGNKFLSSLPAPKGRDNTSGGTASFSKSLAPPSVTKKAASQLAPVIPAKLAPRVIDDSDEDDDDDTTDFFGFSSAPVRKQEDVSTEIPFMAINSSMDVVGPSRRTEEEETDPREMYQIEDDYIGQEGQSASEGWLHRKINDEQAHKLLMRFSHDIGPEERRSINEMANSIVDVNVDDALGPDVKTNIIKNLGHRAFVEATSAPLPQVQTQGQTSRRKHQITYLASLAVSREEQLKDQWAEQKQSKRMARQKYGF